MALNLGTSALVVERGSLRFRRVIVDPHWHLSWFVPDELFASTTDELGQIGLRRTDPGWPTIPNPGGADSWSISGQAAGTTCQCLFQILFQDHNLFLTNLFIQIIFIIQIMGQRTH